MEATVGAWCPYERNYHISRRRRWVRKRLRDKDSKAMDKKRVSVPRKVRNILGKGERLVEECGVRICTCSLQRKREKAMEEGWEYARLAHLTYHITKHRLDFARRRRWIRKLISDKSGERAVFT